MAVKIGNKVVPEATEVMRELYGQENPAEWDALVKEEHLKLEVGQLIYDLRKEANLSQKALAEKVGTSQSVISRAEHGDYEGSCLDILKRVCLTLKTPIEVSRSEGRVLIAC